MKIALITSIPSPYRVLQFDKVAENIGNDFCVFYCAKITSIRKWDIPVLKHNHCFLKDSPIQDKWLNIDIVKRLKAFNPEIIVTSGFFPTSLICYLYAKSKTKKHIIFSDSWVHSVSRLTLFHKIIRKIIIKRSDAFICVGLKGKKFLEAYGAPKNKIFVSPLSIDNAYYSKFIKDYNDKEYDVIFSGRFTEVKMPFFVINIINKIYKNEKKLKLLIIGDGPLKDDIISRLNETGVDYTYPGFIQQPDLPKYYANAKLLLFPTKDDPWGLVANEACAVGTPVLTCDNAGSANDLIIHNENGYVLPLIEEIWAEYTIKVLNDMEVYRKLSVNAIKRVQNYSVDSAANGIIEACKFANACDSKN